MPFYVRLRTYWPTLMDVCGSLFMQNNFSSLWSSEKKQGQKKCVKYILNNEKQLPGEGSMRVWRLKMPHALFVPHLTESWTHYWHFVKGKNQEMRYLHHQITGSGCFLIRQITFKEQCFISKNNGFCVNDFRDIFLITILLNTLPIVILDEVVKKEKTIWQIKCCRCIEY